MDHATYPVSWNWNLSLDRFDAHPPPPDLTADVADDPDAVLGQLFEVHHQTFWHLVTFRIDRRLLARVDADDVIQDAYVEAKKRIGHWSANQRHSLFVWVRMTLLQTLVDVHRRHLGAAARSAGREVSIAGGVSMSSTAASIAGVFAAGGTSPSGAVRRQEDHDQLHAAIESMSMIDQEIIALRHFEGLNNKQAAEVLGLSVTAASNRYVRALSHLQELLEIPTAG